MKAKRGLMGRWQVLAEDQSGSFSVLAAIFLVVVIGFASLALDIGHLAAVKAELQKAADAGALAGARALALPVGVTDWNWQNGKYMAVSIVQKNFVDKISLRNFTCTNVETGFWDLNWTSATPPAHLLGYTSPSLFVPSNNQAAAVKVTISKTRGISISSAPVVASLASVFGINSLSAKASAVAIITPPTKIPYSSAFPFALPLTFVTQHWKDDPPLSFNIASSQHVDSGGQWTSFKTEDNSASLIDGLILGTNTTDTISVDDHIYILSGEKASLYKTAQNQVGQTRYVPVVADGFATGAYTSVLSYVPFIITSVIDSGNNPTITGHFVPGWIDPHAKGGGGKYFGDPLPPKLVN
jgi:Flp pilus assembly protein TadG